MIAYGKLNCPSPSHSFNTIKDHGTKREREREIKNLLQLAEISSTIYFYKIVLK
tara:strand:+ start:418 stop:579 length:162 start_codon:yes stop_codon:yes gene_type:complete